MIDFNVLSWWHTSKCMVTSVTPSCTLQMPWLLNQQLCVTGLIITARHDLCAATDYVYFNRHQESIMRCVWNDWASCNVITTQAILLTDFDELQVSFLRSVKHVNALSKLQPCQQNNSYNSTMAQFSFLWQWSRLYLGSLEIPHHGWGNT